MFCLILCSLMEPLLKLCPPTAVVHCAPPYSSVGAFRVLYVGTTRTLLMQGTATSCRGHIHNIASILP